MARQKSISYLRGKLMRATRLDSFGRAVIGDSNAVVTEGYISVAFTTNLEEGEAINVTNAGGKACVTEAAIPSVTGVGVEATFCNVDFALFELLTGHQVILDANDRIIGLEESTDVKLDAVNFALELWLGATSSGEPSPGSQGEWGYVLLPFLSGGVVGDYTIENAAITFTVNNINSKKGSGWGVGPYAVELVDGEPARLSTPVGRNAYRRTQTVEVAPPEATFSGSVPVLDPDAAPITAITATPTGLSVTFAPTPAGDEGVLYDFGDDNWDYAETGGYTHVYDAPGTYEVIGFRGLTSATTTVTVTAV